MTAAQTHGQGDNLWMNIYNQTPNIPFDRNQNPNAITIISSIRNSHSPKAQASSK
jgi:hypothetical protein